MKHIILAGLVLSSCLAALNASASTVAVVDTGVETENPGLKIWTNLRELQDPQNGLDDDGNGYADDYFGWNFAENNNQVIVRTHFSKEIYSFDEAYSRIQGGDFDSIRTLVRDLILLASKQYFDGKFMKTYERYAGYSHGTHVAGIVQKANPDATILPIRVAMTGHFAEAPPSAVKNGMSVDSAIRLLIDREKARAQDAFDYAARVGAEVVNCSWGTSLEAAMGEMYRLHVVMRGEAPTPEFVVNNARYYMTLLANAYQEVIARYPQMLFVAAAGNDSTNNDKMAHLPSNVRADNLISVAATDSASDPTSFSNGGKYFVDIAAPGSAIKSQMPDGRTSRMSGTSMAAPQVAGIASLMKDKNPNLSAADMKRILMGTVFRTQSLKGFVRSNGRVSLTRAVAAAELAATVGISEAIKQARKLPEPVEPSKTK